MIDIGTGTDIGTGKEEEDDEEVCRLLRYQLSLTLHYEVRNKECD